MSHPRLAISSGFLRISHSEHSSMTLISASSPLASPLVSSFGTARHVRQALTGDFDA